MAGDKKLPLRIPDATGFRLAAFAWSPKCRLFLIPWKRTATWLPVRDVRLTLYHAALDVTFPWPERITHEHKAEFR